MRQPRYKFGTCGLRDCICLLAVIENRGVPTGAQGVPPEGRSGKPGLSAHRPSREDVICCRAIWRPPSGHYPSKVIIKSCERPGFKEWSSDGKGLEFTLATVMPSVLTSIVFGLFSFEREPVQMVRCITADLLCDNVISMEY